MLGAVNSFALEIARATESRSPIDSVDAAEDGLFTMADISFSSSSDESKKLTRASVHPSSILSTSPSIVNLRPALNEMSHASSSLLDVVPGGTSEALSI